MNGKLAQVEKYLPFRNKFVCEYVFVGLGVLVHNLQISSRERGRKVVLTVSRH